MDHNFLDELDPWGQNMPESYFINNLEEDLSIDFIGVKVGDVNGSVITNLQSQLIENRSNRWPLTFTITDKKVKEGPAVVSFYSDSYERISGWQMTLEFDPEDITIRNIESDVIDIYAYHYYIDVQDRGWITISYNSDNPIDLDANQEIFRVDFESQRTLNTGNIFDITSKITPAESYRGLNEIVDVKLRVQQKEASIHNIVSASPNPWKDHTDITFEIGENGLSTWRIYNVRGQLIYSINQNYKVGTHQFKLDRNQIPHEGVYYLKLITESQSSEYKLMVID